MTFDVYGHLIGGRLEHLLARGDRMRIPNFSPIKRADARDRRARVGPIFFILPP
jgi:hypothetical protein